LQTHPVFIAFSEDIQNIFLRIKFLGTYVAREKIQSHLIRKKRFCWKI